MANKRRWLRSPMRRLGAHRWDKSHTLSVLTLLAATSSPLAVAFIANSYAEASKKSEIRIKYVELATSILRAEVKEENAALRSWAVEVLKAQSDVPITPEAEKQFRDFRLKGAVYDYNYTGGWDDNFTGNTPDWKSGSWSTTYPCIQMCRVPLGTESSKDRVEKAK